jgi:hypothetical protein
MHQSPKGKDTSPLIEDTYVAMDFNTAWSPIGVECMQAIVKKYNFIEMTYTYHDEGMDFSGCMLKRGWFNYFSIIKIWKITKIAFNGAVRATNVAFTPYFMEND